MPNLHQQNTKYFNAQTIMQSLSKKINKMVKLNIAHLEKNIFLKN